MECIFKKIVADSSVTRIKRGPELRVVCLQGRQAGVRKSVRV